MSETAKHVSITLTFKTDTEPGLVFAQLMELIGEKQIFVVDSQVRLSELAEDQGFPSFGCTCDGDPIECSHEAARGQAEAERERACGLMQATIDRVRADEEKLGQAALAESRRADAAEARLAELENALCWLTSCLNCASLLDASYGEYVRADKAEQRLARALEAVHIADDTDVTDWQRGYRALADRVRAAALAETVQQQGDAHA